MELLGFKATTGLERGEWDYGKLKHYKVHYSYQDYLIVFNEHSLDCFKPLVNFRSSEKVDFDNFFQCSHCFYGREDFLILPFLLMSPPQAGFCVLFSYLSEVPAL